MQKMTKPSDNCDEGLYWGCAACRFQQRMWWWLHPCLLQVNEVDYRYEYDTLFILLSTVYHFDVNINIINKITVQYDYRYYDINTILMRYQYDTNTISILQSHYKFNTIPDNVVTISTLSISIRYQYNVININTL